MRPPASTVRHVVEALAQRHGTCRACGARIEVYVGAEAPGGFRYVASCHGSTEGIVLTEDDFRRSYDGSKAFERLAAWLRGLFTADCNPDVMELLRYNRGEVPSTP